MTTLELPPTHEVVDLFPRQGEWTEADYWPLSERNRIIELSDGKLIVPPMPTDDHQMIVGNIYRAVWHFVADHKLGRVRMSPLPVRLWPGKIREPDVMVMLSEHQERIEKQRWGPPDLAVEVLSPGTQATDRTEKLREYGAASIQEYWIVSPEQQSVEVYHLEGDNYESATVFRGEMQITSRVLVGFILPVAVVFEEN